MTKIVLLDIDGVLVQPGGYRAAVRAALNHYTGRMGLPDIDITEEKFTELENRGIVSEWDMFPLLLASLWTEILSRRPMQVLPDELNAASAALLRHFDGVVPEEIHVPEFKLVPGQYPSETALQKGCFAPIPAGLRRNILSHTRDVHRSQTTRLFQQYSLGSSRFSETYGLPAEIETESFLLMHDRSNIDDAIRAKLCQPGIHLAAFTARPSYPPREVKESHKGYAPEAELALELVELTDIPLIAFGKLQFTAALRRIDPYALLKPSPVQALAAIASAWSGEELPALQAACDWQETGKLTGVLTELPRSFELILVEDTSGGIHSVRAAGEILHKAGLDVTVRAFGLTSGSPAKAAAFEQLNVPYHETWEGLISGIGL